MARTFYQRLENQILNKWLVHSSKDGDVIYIIFNLDIMHTNNIFTDNRVFADGFFINNAKKSITYDDINPIYYKERQVFLLNIDLAYILNSRPYTDHYMKDKLNRFLAKRLLNG